jgi:putative oxidoreductase
MTDLAHDARSDQPFTRGVRVALGLMFLAAGLAKLFAQGETASLLETHALPFPHALAFAIGAFESLAGLMFLTNTRTRGFSRALMLFVALAALLFHTPFGLPAGVAHATAISITVDVLVLAGLAVVARQGDG